MNNYKSYYLKLFPKSSNRDDIILWLVDIDFIPNYIKKLEFTNHEYIEDYIQEVWLYICEIPQERWDNLFEQGRSALVAFVSGLIFRLIKSANSPIYTKYKKRYKFETKMSDSEWLIYEDTNLPPKNNNIFNE